MPKGRAPQVCIFASERIAPEAFAPASGGNQACKQDFDNAPANG
jgi:hypothetical protein